MSMENNTSSESSRVYALFYSFFLIPLMIVVFGILFYLLFSVITEEPTDINQLLIKLETGSIRDKANASYRINKIFYDDPTQYDSLYRNRIIKIHKMSKSKYLSDNSLRLHTIMIMGNSQDTIFGSFLMEELKSENEEFRIKAIDALGRLKYTSSSILVKNFLKKDNTFLEKLAAAGALGNIGDNAVIQDLKSLIESWPVNWVESDGLELQWEATMALLKLGYSDSTTRLIINNLLDRDYYKEISNNNNYNSLDDNTINFVIRKILYIIKSIDNISLIRPFSDKINYLSENDPNLEIRDFAKKLYKHFK